MIAIFLKSIGVQQWVAELVILLAIVAAVWYWQHERFEAGIADQVAADAAQRAVLIADNDKKTAALQVRATMAEQTYDKERQANIDYQHDNPLEPIRLCLSAPKSGSHLPAAGGQKPGDVSTSTTPADVLSMPAGNSSGGSGGAGPDISNLLSILADKADDVSGVLREFQKRE